MKILAVADLHSKTYRLQRLQTSIAQYDPDLLIIAGDISNYFNPLLVLQNLSQLDLPVFYIRGNSDRTKLDRMARKFSNLTDLNLSPTDFGGMPMIGISGTIPFPFHSKIKLNERKMLKGIFHLINHDTCLVVHPPPYGFQDRVMGRFHAGSKGLSSLIKEKQPKLVLCGHIHEDRGHMTEGRTCIVNCSVGKSGRGTLIEMDEDRKIITVRSF